MKTSLRLVTPLAIALGIVAVASGCSGKKTKTADDLTPVATVTPTPAATRVDPGKDFPKPTPTPVVEVDDPARKSLDEINRGKYLVPVFFAFNEAALTDDSKSRLDANAAFLTKYGTFKVKIEGHCDERGTEDYNMALGERRATAARDYLKVSGVAESRMQTISLGETRPFNNGHDESAWSENRRAHFLVTSTK